MRNCLDFEKQLNSCFHNLGPHGQRPAMHWKVLWQRQTACLTLWLKTALKI